MNTSTVVVYRSQREQLVDEFLMSDVVSSLCVWFFCAVIVFLVFATKADRVSHLPREIRYLFWTVAFAVSVLVYTGLAWVLGRL